MAAQKGDIIYFKGEKMDLFSNPLEDFWIRKKKKRPRFFPDEECRRGYIATWEVRENELFLTEIDGAIQKKTFFFGKKQMKYKYALKSLFTKVGPEGMKATWFSGKLRIPCGKMTQYEHSGYDSRFEKEMILTIDHGELLKVRTIDYTQRSMTVSW